MALFALVGMVVVLFWRLALTDLIIGRGDLFFYFYPYRDYASAAVRAGRVPLWNPYLFMGAPFLANSQAGFFYPLNLALAWLPVERMVNASLVIHTALAAVGAYLWGRGSLRLARPGAWLAGLCYGLGGYFVAQVEHLNQVQVLAWLPWLLWLFPWPAAGARLRAAFGRGGVRFAGLAAIASAQLLAGHTQAVFISVFGLGLYAVLPLWLEVIRKRAHWRRLAPPVVLLLGVVLASAGLAAAQLLPTLELSRLSVRSGGLPYREAASFSLQPALLGRALLPGWGEPLFPEFVAYVGVAGLALVVAGAVEVWHGNAAAGAVGGYHARRGALVLAVCGLFLAIGGYNPVYFALVKLVPGFGLFRAPARWLALYAVGAAGLAGIGLDRLAVTAGAQRAGELLRWPGRGRVTLGRAWAGTAVALLGPVLLERLLGGEPEAAQQAAELAPTLRVTSAAGWFVAALLFAAAVYAGARSGRRVSASVTTGGLVALVTLELLGGSLSLPLNRATAPGALTSLRPAVAHLLAEARMGAEQPPARLLSISDIFFDPGDKQEIEMVWGPQLSSAALYDYVIATKQKEVLIPNLPLYYRLPSMDGYDGGVLPLRRYVTLERLYMPEESVAMDGRLRENLDEVPDGRWLSLFNVRFVVTDKVGDAWFDDVFYDLQMGASLEAGEEAAVGYVPPMPATALGLVYRADGAAAGAELVRATVVLEDGRELVLPLSADGNAPGDRVARLRWQAPGTVASVSIRGTWQAGTVTVRGLSLIDERSGAFQSLTLSDRGRYRLVHSGDVKIYENLDVLPRLLFVPDAIVVSSDQAALDAMGEPGFDPAAAVVLIAAGAAEAGAEGNSVPVDAPGTRGPVNVLRYEPERVSAVVDAPADGWLLQSDAWYPGWQARVDGEPVPIRRADVLFRAVPVPAGQHHVEWVYQPASFGVGAVLSFVTLGLLLAGPFAVISSSFWRAASRSSRCFRRCSR